MVARINVKNALIENFYYNENKIEAAEAVCLMAANYPKDMEGLTQGQRLKMLQKLAGLNEDIKVNSVHVSLNFDPSENLSQDRLKQIASDYMQLIGFGQQPYLVYQHFDAGHPHLHLLSVKVAPDGKGLDTHNIGVKRSEPARKSLEIKYNLVKADDHKQQQQYNLKSAYVAKVQYGKTESRRAIANVLEHVLKSYNYTSLPELNAVLKLYNVMVDRCNETSRVYQNKGLLYRILDTQGNAVGVPIKASRFYQQPTLKFLEEHFALNAAKRLPVKGRIKLATDRYFLNNSHATVTGFVESLKREAVDVILRQNDKGIMYGITYVDHKNKAVFNGSDLGKQYSAKGIQERCAQSAPVAKGGGLIMVKDPAAETRAGKEIEGLPSTSKSESSGHSEKGLLEILTQSEQGHESVPYPLKKTRKKKLKRFSDNR